MPRRRGPRRRSPRRRWGGCPARRRAAPRAPCRAPARRACHRSWRVRPARRRSSTRRHVVGGSRPVRLALLVAPVVALVVALVPDVVRPGTAVIGARGCRVAVGVAAVVGGGGLTG